MAVPKDALTGNDLRSAPRDSNAPARLDVEPLRGRLLRGGQRYSRGEVIGEALRLGDSPAQCPGQGVVASRER